MEGTSSASMTLTSTPEDLYLVDDFYFSALYDAEEIFPISDEKYAEELQLQETLYSSAISSTRVNNQVIQVDVDVDGDTPSRTFKRKQKEIGESSQVRCGICMDGKPGEEMFSNQNCSHAFCNDCIGIYVASKIQENISMVKCPDPKCTGVLESQYCRSIIPEEVFDRWENALCENLVLGSQKFYCPFKDCSAMLISDAEEVVTSSECPYCNRLFCAQCKVSWHAGIDCMEFRSLKQYEREREDLMVMELAKDKSWRRCPKCNFYVEKSGGCSHISCRCGNEFCYACGSSWTLHDTEEIFPVSYEKNKEKLKLQEALYYSPMSGTEAKNGVIQVGDTPLGTLKRNQKGTDESSQVYCGICMDGKPGEEMFRNQNCLHSFCNDCIGMYVATKIRENISIIKCPDPICREILDSQYCRSIIPKEVFDRWQNTLCENLVPGSQKFYCPFKDCSAMLIYDAEEVVTSSECPHCNRLFCAQCKAPWHAGIDCREFQSMQQHERAREDLMLMELAKNKRWKRCPECNFFVEKTGGCSEITCSF
ncbi:E3 ubiquitin-protein ligase RNF144A, partial [Mucuna pruriens]